MTANVVALAETAVNIANSGWSAENELARLAELVGWSDSSLDAVWVLAAAIASAAECFAEGGVVSPSEAPWSDLVTILASIGDLGDEGVNGYVIDESNRWVREVEEDWAA